MAIYFGESAPLIEGTSSGNQAFRINTGTYDNLNVDTFGNHKKRPIGFIVGFNGSGWVQQTSSPWKYTNFNVSTYNSDNCFNFSNSRFVCPVAGWYIFVASQYNYKTSGSASDYCHPMFYVNGSGNARRVGNLKYRMRGRFCAINYSFDSQIEEIMYLEQGDFVEFYSPTITTIQYFSGYGHFSGFLIG